LRRLVAGPKIVDVGKEGTRSGSTAIGSTIAGHRVARLIGSGKLGRVFEVYTPKEERRAIKLLRSKFKALGDPLLHNARAMTQARGPHVVTVYDVAVFNGAPYVVMDLVEGDDLRSRVRRGALGSADALRATREAALGLQLLWAHGIAHGDVRPANLLTDVEGVRVVDAMLAPPIAGTDNLRGSPDYLAPERMLGTPPDSLSDIYALGCTLFELLSGAPPFEGSVGDVLEMHASKPIPPLASHPSVVDLVARMTAKDRAQRAKTWSEVIEGIDRALEGAGQQPPTRASLPAIEVDTSELADLDDDIRTAEVPAFTTKSEPPAHTPARGRKRASAPANAPDLPRTHTPFARVPPSNPNMRAPAPVASPAPAPVPIAPPVSVAPIPVVPVAPPSAAPAVIPIAPLMPTLPELDEQHTVIRPMQPRPAPIPSAEDVGLTLDPIDDD
jgi:serine/threonine-protein kinase